MREALMFSFLFGDKTRMVEPADALPGRPVPMPGVEDRHAVLGTSLRVPPAGAEVAVFGLGCFWGAERVFWKLPGVLSTSVGYAGGFTPNPTYNEVCSGKTGHNEVVRVFFDPAQVTYAELARTFFESHDPTQGMRQGHDVGTQYRSMIVATSEAQRVTAQQLLEAYQTALTKAGHVDPITTEILRRDSAPEWYFLGEDYHQQYLHKNPGGYCGIGGTGVSCPVGLGA
jgi:peptide-methionine (S)-S-oxide reductase